LLFEFLEQVVERNETVVTIQGTSKDSALIVVMIQACQLKSQISDRINQAEIIQMIQIMGNLGIPL
tara:strand:- start:434 stop:631 length:198 start_codon:yes stop_codon:yes gene_type:complete